jgi:hypothetical protein
MSPVQFIGLVMTGVEEYLEGLCDRYHQVSAAEDEQGDDEAEAEFVEKGGSDGEEGETEGNVDMAVTTGDDRVRGQDEILLTEFCDEFLWTADGQYMGGFLSHAVHCLVSGSSYPLSTALLRHVLPRLEEMLERAETGASKGEDVGPGGIAGGIRVLLRAITVATFTGELLSNWQLQSSHGSAIKDVELGSINSDILALMSMAAGDIVNLFSDADPNSASAVAMRLATAQMTEGQSRLVLQPILMLMCAEWTLPQLDDFPGRLLNASFLKLFLKEMAVLASGKSAIIEERNISQALAFLYDVVRYFDAMDLMDFSRKQVMLNFVDITKQSKELSSYTIGLLDGIEKFVNCR